jgi:hypothetical protein
MAFQSLKRGPIGSNQLKRDPLMTPAVLVRPCRRDRTRRTCRVARRLPSHLSLTNGRRKRSAGRTRNGAKTEPRLLGDGHEWPRAETIHTVKTRSPRRCG